MKRWTILAAAAALSVSTAALAGAAPSMHERHAVAEASAAAVSHSGVGVVRKVDASHGKVTLQHEAIASLGWPAMIMAFEVKDARLLAGLEPGRKVRFAFVHEGASYVITSLE